MRERCVSVEIKMRGMGGANRQRSTPSLRRLWRGTARLRYLGLLSSAASHARTSSSWLVCSASRARRSCMLRSDVLRLRVWWCALPVPAPLGVAGLLGLSAIPPAEKKKKGVKKEERTRAWMKTSAETTEKHKVQTKPKRKKKHHKGKVNEDTRERVFV